MNPKKSQVSRHSALLVVIGQLYPARSGVLDNGAKCSKMIHFLKNMMDIANKRNDLFLKKQKQTRNINK